MSNRIQPTHFIEVWKGYEATQMHSEPKNYKDIDKILYRTTILQMRTVALFLIRPKTQQEKENSIYYPQPTNK